MNELQGLGQNESTRPWIGSSDIEHEFRFGQDEQTGDGLSHVTPCHISHLVTSHILSHVTPCHISHLVTSHISPAM